MKKGKNLPYSLRICQALLTCNRYSVCAKQCKTFPISKYLLQIEPCHEKATSTLTAHLEFKAAFVDNRAPTFTRSYRTFPCSSNLAQCLCFYCACCALFSKNHCIAETRDADFLLFPQIHTRAKTKSTRVYVQHMLQQLKAKQASTRGD